MAHNMGICDLKNPGDANLPIAIIQRLHPHKIGMEQKQTALDYKSTPAAMAKHEPTTSNMRTLLSNAEELKSRVGEIVRRL